MNPLRPVAEGIGFAGVTVGGGYLIGKQLYD